MTEGEGKINQRGGRSGRAAPAASAGTHNPVPWVWIPGSRPGGPRPGM